MVYTFLEASSLQEGQGAIAHNLTSHQRQVLRLVAEGLTSQQIGEKLGLSARTVECHVANIMGRLGVRSRIDLVKYAIRTGLVDVDESGGMVQRAKYE